jgi:hypothetical protein
MAYKHPDKEVQLRTLHLVGAVNAALNAYYAKSNTPANKRISIALSLGKGGQSRAPEEQAEYLLKGTSWTANSSHMADGAKHILVREGPTVTWKLNQLHAKEKAAFEVMVKAWNAAMKTHDLRNYKGGPQFDYKGSDPLHMELPHSRLHDNDPRVIKTLEIYAKATRHEGKAKNVEYETKKGSAFQKSWLQAYDQKLAQQNKVAKGP